VFALTILADASLIMMTHSARTRRVTAGLALAILPVTKLMEMVVCMNTRIVII